MLELTPYLTENSTSPLYMQLYQYMKQEILEGRIPPNSHLPSVRKLGSRLGLSRTPIATAYEQLLAEGYIYSKPRKGVFAACLVRTEQMEVNVPTFDYPNGALSISPTTPPDSSLGYTPNDLPAVDFGYGRVDLSTFPITRWRRIFNECLLPHNQGLLQYGDPQGERGLREELAAYLHQHRGVRCTPEQIIIGAGTYHSLDLALQLLGTESLNIAAEAAVNVGVQSILRRFSLQQVLPLKLQQDGCDVRQLWRSSCKVVYVTPSHQFPYGYTMSAAKRLELLHWAREANGMIMENDYDNEFRYTGRPIPSLQGLDESGNHVIYIGTFSRAITPAFRISYAVLPLRFLKEFHRGVHSYDQLASPLLQEALRRFMRVGELDRHIRRMRVCYTKKRAAMLEAIQEHLGSQVQIMSADSGLHLLLQVHLDKTEEELVRSALLHGVRVYPTGLYHLDHPQVDPPTLLLGFGGLTVEEIEEGMLRLGQAWIEEL